MGRAGCNGAALSRHLDGLLFGKGSAKGKPALLVVQAGQPDERRVLKVCFPATFVAEATQSMGLLRDSAP